MTRLVRVIRKWQEAERIFGFELEDSSGAGLPSFEPGAHIDVHIRGARTRQYSLCALSPGNKRYQIAVQREVNSRGGSETLCTAVHEGDTLEISDPRNHFRLVPAEHTILLAGGIGITPLICMAEQLAHAEASFELHYCTQTRVRTAFQQRIAAARYRTNTFFHFDDGAPSQKLDTEFVLRDPRPNRRLYVCGPPGFLQFVRDRARQYGWGGDHVHFEYFSAPASEAHAETDSFQVVSARSGRTVSVGKDE